MTDSHHLIPSVGRREIVALGVIAVVAAGLRLAYPGLSQFRLDEAHISSLALDLASLRSLPLTGTRSSVGVYLPPWGNYIYAIPFAIYPSAMAAVVFTGLWNLAGVLICWAVARRYWGPAGGLTAALLLGVNPWAVAYSRQIWQPDLMATLAAATMGTALLGFIEGKGWALTTHLLLLSVMVQTHFSGAVLVPITIALLIVFHRRVQWKPLIIGLGGALLLALPYIVHLISRGSEAWAALAGATSPGLELDSSVFHVWWMTTSGGRAHALLGQAASGSWLMTNPLFRLAPWLVFGLACVSALYWVTGRCGECQGVSRTAALLVLAWYLMPLVAFSCHSTPVYQHYMAVALPTAPLLVASLIGEAVERYLSTLRAWTLVGLGALGVAEALASAALLVSLATQATPGGFGFPLGQQLRAAEEARRRGGEVIVLAEGDSPAFYDWPAVFEVHLWGTPHRFVDGRHAALFPAATSSLIIAGEAEMGMECYRWASALGPLVEIAGRPGEPPLCVGELAGGMKPNLVQAPQPALLANGVEILGYHLEGQLGPGETITWRVGWQVVAEGHDSSPSYHIFNHLIDEQGRLWAQCDSPTIPTYSWHMGDIIVQSFRLTLPDDAPSEGYYARVGMYTFPEMQPQDVLDVAGNPGGQFVLLGPLESQ